MGHFPVIILTPAVSAGAKKYWKLAFCGSPGRLWAVTRAVHRVQSVEIRVNQAWTVYYTWHVILLSGLGCIDNIALMCEHCDPHNWASSSCAFGGERSAFEPFVTILLDQLVCRWTNWRASVMAKTCRWPWHSNAFQCPSWGGTVAMLHRALLHRSPRLRCRRHETTASY